MEAFLKNTAYKVRAAMRAGDRNALEQELHFCRQWGGPLELVALVAEQHLQLMEQGKLHRPTGTAVQESREVQSPLLQLLRERREAC
jgi:hypothetical protein